MSETTNHTFDFLGRCTRCGKSRITLVDDISLPCVPFDEKSQPPIITRNRGVWGGSLNGAPFRDPVQRAAVGIVGAYPALVLGSPSRMNGRLVGAVTDLDHGAVAWGGVYGAVGQGTGHFLV